MKLYKYEIIKDQVWYIFIKIIQIIYLTLSLSTYPVREDNIWVFLQAVK
jgi:hypothetical protein